MEFAEFPWRCDGPEASARGVRMEFAEFAWRCRQPEA